MSYLLINIFFINYSVCRKIHFNVTWRMFTAQLPSRTSLKTMILLEESWRTFDPCKHPPPPTVYESEIEFEVYILLPDKYQVYRSGRDIVGQYRPGSQVQQPIPGCALKPRPLFRGCISLISRAVFKSRWNT